MTERGSLRDDLYRCDMELEKMRQKRKATGDFPVFIREPTPTELTAYERGYRRGTIEARAELTALWRGRVADVLTILQAPVPNQAPSKPVQEKT